MNLLFVPSIVVYKVLIHFVFDFKFDTLKIFIKWTIIISKTFFKYSAISNYW